MMCGFGLTSVWNDGYFFTPYCHCGWVGEIRFFHTLPAPLDLERMARAWEAHRTQFARQRREMARRAP